MTSGEIFNNFQFVLLLPRRNFKKIFEKMDKNPKSHRQGYLHLVKKRKTP